MKQYNTVNSGELKALSNLLTELMVLDDPIQSDRLTYIIDGGRVDSRAVDGLLALVKNKALNLDNLKMFILDECDRVLDNVSK